MRGITQYVNEEQNRLREIGRRARRIARAKEVKAAKEAAYQKTLNRRFDQAIMQAVQGMTALMAVRGQRQVQEAVGSLAKIGQSLVLYQADRDGGSAWEALVSGERDEEPYVWGVRKPYDHELTVFVDMGVQGVGIHIELISGHSNLKSRSYQLWITPRTTTAKLKFHLSKLAFWDTQDIMEVKTLAELHRWNEVNEDLLDLFKGRSVALAAKPGQREFEWTPEFLLLRFLQKCANSRNLQRYLTKAKPSGD